MQPFLCICEVLLGNLLAISEVIYSSLIMSSPLKSNFAYYSDIEIEASKALELLQSRCLEEYQLQQSYAVAPPSPPSFLRSMPLLVFKSAPRKKRSPRVVVSSVSQGTQDHPDWLPKGWKIERRPRPGGKHFDKFYYNPQGYQFRSKIEVLYYLENGERRKPKPKKQLMKNAMPMETSDSSCLDSGHPSEEGNASSAKGSWCLIP